MVVSLAFWLFLGGALTVGWLAGDRRDRPILIAIGLAAMTTQTTQAMMDFATWRFVLVAIDLALLCFVSQQALSSARHWPMWFAGFHAMTLLCNFIALFLSGPGQMAMFMLGAFWSLPALAALIIGVLRDRRAGLAPATSQRPA